MIGPQLLTRAGVAVSVIVHVALLAWIIIFANARPFEPMTAEAITVDIVRPDEVPQPQKDSEAPAQPPETPPIPDTPQTSEKAAAASPPPAPSPPAPPPRQQQASQSQPTPAPAPQAAPPPPEPDPPRAQPDITSKFGMMFSMPDGTGTGDFDAAASQAANISMSAAAALRAHLKTCSVLPKSISRGDNVRIVMRVAFLQDGTLATEPLLIEASASTKGPALMESAIKALHACQPYSVLPADKYNEWKMLDLSFTPKDFKGE